MVRRASGIRKKKRKKTRKQVENTLSGGKEPTFEYKSQEPDDVAWYNLLAYNWYNQQLKAKNHRAWVVAFAKADEKYTTEHVDALRKVSSDSIMAWDAIYARSLMKGAQFSDEKMATFNASMKEYLREGREKLAKAKAKTAEDTDSVKRKSIQDHINDKVDSYRYDLDPEIDKFTQDGKTDFSLYTWLTKNDVPGVNAHRMIERWLQPMILEIAGAIKKTDEQLVEAYEFMDTKRQKAYAVFLLSMKKDIETWVENSKKKRKPRKKKAVSATRKVAKLNYKDRDDEYKIASINPETIIEADTLWAFNTVRRELVKFVAKTNFSLDIKGSTLQNVDLSVSYSKKLRKPMDVLPLIAGKKKTAIDAAVKTITSKPRKAKSSRINKHMVLLTVI